MRLRSLFQTLFRKSAFDRELDDELQCAIDELAARHVVALYFPCRWFAELKARKRSVWLSHL